MRRSTTLLLALVVAMPAVLAACGDDDSSGTDATATEDGHDDGGHDDTSPVADGARKIEVTASSFAFDPEEITVSPGEEVSIVLTSEDVLHDFTVDELDAHVAADVGETVAGGLTADEAGEYTYYCAVPGHRAAGMEGTLIVEAP
ncbi:MAG TPA: plastocyanin/azurin family copper-binding protein [Acidimicrobiales bacterium]|nr:plastocyanin/azurin family copper-binding protein [Acidimicrobiales bacterium]